MFNRKVLNIILSIFLLTSVVLGGFIHVAAAPASDTDETKVPHYFGPYPNWANSPLAMPDAQVVITGNGSGAAAVAAVGADGAITGITITNPGHDYSNAQIDIVGSGTGATAKATIVKKGAVAAITMDPDAFGSGYTAPVVTISGGGGATATAYGRVDQVAVTVEGSGYTFPTVDFDLPDGPGGVQASGHAVCEGDPVEGPYCEGGPPLTIVRVEVDSPGSGYSSAPGVAIHNGTLFDPIALDPVSPAVGNYAQATSSLSITSIVLDTFGAGYKKVPDVTISDPTGSGATATAVLDNGVISLIEVKDPGTGYITPGGIRKFVDGLPGLTAAGANNLGQYLPIAVPDTTTFTDTDYYVIALVQYRERMHSDLPETLLREYVQLILLEPGQNSQDCINAGGVPLVTDLLVGTEDLIMTNGSRACGVDNPHFLGPVIIAQKDRAVRIVFYNLLPTGSDGDLFLPTDSTIMGSGLGPDDWEEWSDPLDAGTVMDGVRNQLCTEYPKPDSCFKDNRATLHLHGGITPWISDGTPHQWITPAGEDPSYPEGVSVVSVPDMVTTEAIAAGVPDCSNPDDGCMTFYYTNQQSARFMFYHDHAWGITRLNVYAGEAAGYLIRDKTEQALIDSGIIPGTNPGEEIPLVIQDRTFVPDADQLAWQDPTWDTSRWGGYGNLWYHHVYMPAQNPGDPSGMSAFGRWMYGPWFWPPAIDAKYQPIDNPYFDPNCNLDDPFTWQYDTDPFCEPALMPGTPNIAAGMEQFNDTPIVNGTAYPTVTLDPQSYRLRILNAANDRFWNLQWYVADSTGTEVALNAAEVAAAQTDPVIFPTPVQSAATAGPDWIQIGTEGGFLPAPVVVDGQQPTTWVTDPTVFNVGNVDKHSLLLAPAERADVIVDFSQFAGQTLILYNDAPAAFPARVPSYDYYTGDPDLSPVGAPTTLPGYGPNTRTIMQVVIASGSSPAFNLSALQAAFRHHADGSGVFEEGQHPIIVGQAAYNSAYGTSFASGGWCNSPSNPSAKCDGFARISEQGGDLFKFDTLSGEQVSIPLEPKAIHDEMNSASFDEFGRMTANLGLEAVPATPGLQNILLYPYTFPTTEIIDTTNLPKNDVDMTPISPISSADGTQIWKITHNGVDTHPIHFHLYDVQVLNRVTWDNIIIPPDASELGWKDTLRVSPLEDTIVALRAIIPYVPFDIPNSVRELSPMHPDGAELASATDADINGTPMTSFSPQGEPIDIDNHLVNFGWEYVFHCHILSHEEMDMMRPVLVAIPPVAPSELTLVAGTLSWNDNSLSETAFVVEKLVNGEWTPVYQLDRPIEDPLNPGEVNPNTTGGVLSTEPLTFADGDYRVFAQNTVGDTFDYANPAINELVEGIPDFPVVTTKSAYAYWAYAGTKPAAPSDLTAANIGPNSLTLNWLDNSSNEDGFNVEISVDDFATVLDPFTVGANVTSLDFTGLTPATMYYFRVEATNTDGTLGWSATLAETTLALPPAPLVPSGLSATNIAETSLTLSWVNNEVVNPVDGFTVQVATDLAFTLNFQEFPVGAGVTSLDFTGLTAATMYYFRVEATNLGGTLGWSAPLTVTTLALPPAPLVPSGLSATNIAEASLTLSWVDNELVNPVDGFNVEMADINGVLDTFPVGANVTTLDITGLTPATMYYFRVEATNLGGTSGWSDPALAVTTLATPTTPPLAPVNLVSAPTLSSLTLTWADTSDNEAGFTVQIATNKGFSQNLQTITVPANVIEYSFYPLAPNTKYYLRVRAFNVAGPSAWAPTITDKTLK